MTISYAPRLIVVKLLRTLCAAVIDRPRQDATKDYILRERSIKFKYPTDRHTVIVVASCAYASTLPFRFRMLINRAAAAGADGGAGVGVGRRFNCERQGKLASGVGRR